MKERKEIEEVEKTVTIRFANYTILMRAQALTHGLSAQLQMFLTQIGPNGNVVSNKEDGLTKALLVNEKQETDIDGLENKLPAKEDENKQTEWDT